MYKKIKLLKKLNLDVGGLGPARTIKRVEIGARPEIELGLITTHQLGMKVRHKSFREPEQVIETH
jgi:hypothetical protein